MLIKVCQSCVRVVLGYVKAFARDELDLALVDPDTLVTLSVMSMILLINIELVDSSSPPRSDISTPIFLNAFCFRLPRFFQA